VAGGLTGAIRTCPFDLYLRVFTPGFKFGEYIKVDLPVLQKGMDLADLTTPWYLGEDIRLSLGGGAKGPTILIKTGNSKKEYTLAQSVLELLPYHHYPYNRWRIGFSIGEDLNLNIHALDQCELEEKKTPLPELKGECGGFYLY